MCLPAVAASSCQGAVLAPDSTLPHGLKRPCDQQALGQELFKSPLDGPNWALEARQPKTSQSNDKLAFFLNQRMKNASKWDCIACKPLPLDTPVVLRAPTLDEWIME